MEDGEDEEVLKGRGESSNKKKVITMDKLWILFSRSENS